MSPDLTLALVAVLTLAAYVVAVRSGRWLAKITVFAALGIALGPNLAGLVDPQRHGMLEAIAAIGLTYLTLGLGARLVSGARGDWTGPLLATATIGTVVAAAMMVLGVSLAAAAALGAIAATAAWIPLDGHEGTPPGDEWTSHARTAASVVALLVALPLLGTTSASTEALAAVVELAVLATLVGWPAGHIVAWAAGQDDDAVRGGSVLGVVILIALVARIFGAWGGVAGLIAGLTAARRLGPDATERLLSPFDELISLSLFVVLGAATHRAAALPAVAASVGLLAARSASEWAIARASGAQTPARLAVGDVVSPVAVGMAAVAVIALTQQGQIVAAGTVGTATLVARYVSEMIRVALERRVPLPAHHHPRPSEG